MIICGQRWLPHWWSHYKREIIKWIVNQHLINDASIDDNRFVIVWGKPFVNPQMSFQLLQVLNRIKSHVSCGRKLVYSNKVMYLSTILCYLYFMLLYFSTPLNFREKHCTFHYIYLKAIVASYFDFTFKTYDQLIKYDYDALLYIKGPHNLTGVFSYVADYTLKAPKSNTLKAAILHSECFYLQCFYYILQQNLLFL